MKCLRAKWAMFTKKCILLQKIAFWAFFVNCKNWKWISKQFFSNFKNWLNKLLHETIGVKLLKFHFHLLQFRKKAQKAIFWSKIHFDVKFVIFTAKLLKFRIIHLAYTKHVETLCILLFESGYINLSKEIDLSPLLPIYNAGHFSALVTK